MTTDDFERRIREAIVRALATMPDATVPLAMGMTPGWDSIGHMNVVMELEAEFKTGFPAYELPDLVDVPSIARVLRGKLAR
jgi:acyl carrier protein